MHYNAETHETIVSGLGERHLEVNMAKLKRKFGVTAELTKPQIAYRETIKGKGEGQGRHKKQSGGRGQFGDCWVRFAPLPRGEGYVFVDEIVGGSIPGKFIPAVDRGIQEAAARGILAGYPLVDFKVECYDGSYHSVDSNEMSFKMAGILAFKAVAPKCKPVLLEPLDELEISTPGEYLGDVMGDVSARRGHILGSDSLPDEPRHARARGDPAGRAAPVRHRSLVDDARSRGFTRKFRGYEEVPGEAAQKIIAESSKKEEVLAEA